MTDEDVVDRYQTALLELLVSEGDVDTIVEHLRSDPAFAPFAEYVATFEPRMIEVAAALVKRWANRPSS